MSFAERLRWAQMARWLAEELTVHVPYSHDLSLLIDRLHELESDCRRGAELEQQAEHVAGCLPCAEA